MGDVALTAAAGGAQTASTALAHEVSLDGIAGQLRHRDPAALGFVTEPGVQVIGELDRSPLPDSEMTAVRANLGERPRTEEPADRHGTRPAGAYPSAAWSAGS
jgi:hypothetical protein